MLQVSKDGSSTNVTGRLALATTPQAVLRTYEGIAYGFTNQKLAQYFQGLLAQAGMNVTVQLMSLSGVPLAAAPTQADLVSCALSYWPRGELAVEVAARGMSVIWQLALSVAARKGRERDVAAVEDCRWRWRPHNSVSLRPGWPLGRLYGQSFGPALLTDVPERGHGKLRVLDVQSHRG